MNWLDWSAGVTVGGAVGVVIGRLFEAYLWRRRIRAYWAIHPDLRPKAHPLHVIAGWEQ